MLFTLKLDVSFIRTHLWHFVFCRQLQLHQRNHKFSRNALEEPTRRGQEDEELAVFACRVIKKNRTMSVFGWCHDAAAFMMNETSTFSSQLQSFNQYQSRWWDINMSLHYHYSFTADADESQWHNSSTYPENMFEGAKNKPKESSWERNSFLFHFLKIHSLFFPEFANESPNEFYWNICQHENMHPGWETTFDLRIAKGNNAPSSDIGRYVAGANTPNSLHFYYTIAR